MNSIVFSILAFCLAAQCASAQYQSAAPAAGYSQRKMAPSPQTYGQPSGYQQEQPQYGAELGANEQPQPPQALYGAGPQSYGKQQQQAGSYGRQPAASSYGQPAGGYAKPAARYEEPYHPPMPFAWGYDINDGYGGAQYHKESGDEYGKRTGSYGYTDAYGIYRQVDYIADENGFRATVKTNEPGTANESPADVEWHAYEPPSNYYAGSAYSTGGKQQSYGSGGASYGGAQQESSYGQQAGGYSAPRAQGSSYGQQQQQQASYGAPARSVYAPAKPAARQYEPAAQYSSSAIVPIYQKPSKAGAASAPAKRY